MKGFSLKLENKAYTAGIFNTGDEMQNSDNNCYTGLVSFMIKNDGFQ